MLRAGGMGRLADGGERADAAAARAAVEVGDLAELKTLSEAVAFAESSRAACLDDLDAAAKNGREAALASYARRIGMLPGERPAPRWRVASPKPPQRNRAARAQRDDAAPAARSRDGRERGLGR